MLIYVAHVAELWKHVPGSCNPTGDLVEVIEGRVQDDQGNVLFMGTAEECWQKKFTDLPEELIARTRLVPSAWQRTLLRIETWDYMWDPVVL